MLGREWCRDPGLLRANPHSRSHPTLAVHRHCWILCCFGFFWPSDEEEDGEAPTRLSIGFGVAAHISLKPPERIELREDVVVVDMMVRIAADNGQQLRSKRGKRKGKVLDGWLEGDEEEESWVVGRVTWAAVNDALIVCHHYCHSPDDGRYQKDTFAIQHDVAASREERDVSAFVRSRLAL